MFEWYVVRCGSKNKRQSDTCSKEIGLCAQNTLTIRGSVVNMIEGGILYDHLYEYENLHFDSDQNILIGSKHHEANGYKHNLDLLNVTCTSCMFRILQEVNIE